MYERRNTEPAELSALSGPVTETWNALRKFVGDAGGAGAISLACVTVTALTTLNKRQLVMENAASGFWTLFFLFISNKCKSEAIYLL